MGLWLESFEKITVCGNKFNGNETWDNVKICHTYPLTFSWNI